MTEVNLRPALETDASSIRDLIHRVGINPLNLDWRHFEVAEGAAGKFIGCAQLKPHSDDSIELASLAVEAEYRKQGVARMLIEHLLAHSSRPLYLMCRPGLVPFYKKYGFKVCPPEEMPHYFRRIHRLSRVFGILSHGDGPAIMRLD